MGIRKPILALALLMGAGRMASAGSYFVDSQGGSDLNAGKSADQAWQTLATANKAALKAGDSLLFKCGGAWTGQLTLKASGAEHVPIVVSSYGSGAAPVFENPGKGNGNAVNISGDWIVLENVLVRNVFQVGISIDNGADHDILRNLEVTDCGIGAYMAGQYGLVTQSHFHDMHMVVNTPGGNDDNGAVGAVFANSDNEVSYNRFIRCVGPSADYGVDGGAVEIWAEKDLRNIYVHHNFAYRCCGFFEIGGLGFAVEGVRVAYNELVDCFGLSFLFVNNSGDYTITLKDYRFENNTLVVHDCPGEKIWTCIAWDTPSEPGVFTMRNNLFYVFNADRILVNVTSPVEDHNLVFHGGTAFFQANFTPSATDIVGKDPLLQNPGTCADNGDYRLKPGSAAIHAGTALGYAADLRGVAVPTGGLPEIGAYEFADGVTAVVPSAGEASINSGRKGSKGSKGGEAMQAWRSGLHQGRNLSGRRVANNLP